MKITDAVRIYTAVRRAYANLKALPVAGFVKLFGVVTFAIDKMQFEVSIYITRKR